jgi:hypothetical protein
MDGWMDGWVDGWMGGWMDGWMGGWMDGWVDGWVDGWMGGWVGGWMDGWVGGWLPSGASVPDIAQVLLSSIPNSMQSSPSLPVLQLVKKLPAFLEFGDSAPLSQQPTIYLDPKPDQSSPRLNLPGLYLLNGAESFLRS